MTNMGTNDVTTRGRIEYGEVDIGIGVSGVEEATEADGVWCFPNLENPIYVNKVVKEAAMFVPALTGPNGSQDGDQ
jgi:hypothetical protein